MKTSWQSYIERLKADPQDAEALEALEQMLAQQANRPTVTQKLPLFGAAKVGVYFFFGGLLYKNIVKAWDAWSRYFVGAYEPIPPLMRAWPEAETRDVAAALAARFVRIGMVAIFLAIMPSALMIVQVYQIQQQNSIITEQNALTREQFGVSYRTQLVQQLYEQSECGKEAKRTDYGQDKQSKIKRGYCPPSQMLRVRQEAARSLIQLYKLQDKPALLSRVNLDGAEFESADFARVDLRQATLKRINFQGTNLDKAVFKESLLISARLQKASLKAAVFTGADLTNAKFNGANLDGAILRRVKLKGVDLTGASLKRAVFYKSDKPVRDDYGEHLRWSDVYRIKETNFSGANLIRSIFQGVKLQKATFDEATLTQANFIKATIKGGSFKKADLKGANFAGALVEGVDMKGANMKGANMTDAKFKDVTCPDGTNSDRAGFSCKGHETP